MILNKFKKSKKQSGMTFIEIVVVMGIFAAIAGTVLFNYGDFSANVRLQTLAQEIALLGKRAQTSASQGVKPFFPLGTLQGSNDDPNFIPSDMVSSYGVAFRLPENTKSFFLYFNSPAHYDFNFVDPGSTFSNQGDLIESLLSRELTFHDFLIPGLESCGGVPDSECIEQFFISDSSEISLICLGASPLDSPNCEEGDIGSELHVSFTRPFLDSVILGLTQSNTDYQVYSSGFIKITNQFGSSRYITFWSSGQISVN